VYGIVVKFKGQIQVESQEGKGTKISILLPCALSTAPAQGN